MSYAIAAGHDATADAAHEILKAGGNAFDAAIAAFITTFIAEPCMSSAGGGAFANIRKADGTCLVYDFFCQTPRFRKPINEVEFLPVDVDFGTTVETFHIGKGSVGVPGSIAGIFALHQHLGSMPMRDLVQLPIEYAKAGIEVNNFQALDFKLLKDILKVTENGRKLYYKNDSLIQKGEVLKMPDIADFLDYISIAGNDAFYKGEIAQKIVADQAEGGFLQRADFENYKVIIRQPLSLNYKNRVIHTNPLPSIGGALMVHYLKFLEQIELSSEPLSRDHVMHLYHTFSKSANLNRRPAALAQSLKSLFGKNKKHGSTTHFNIVDKWGNAVSLTATNGEGCGRFIEGTDIQLNNMLGEAALLPDGFHTWDPDVRLSSMMAPTIVTDVGDALNLVIGSGGAGRIPSAITQVLHYLFDFDQSIEAAVNKPRVHLGHGVFNIEPGFNADFSEDSFEEELEKWDHQSLFFGGTHSILSKDGTLSASGDSRRDGVVRIG